MKYAEHYSRLIQRARARTLDGYQERHHVIPRCMGGGRNKDNLVYLTPEEHYLAHQMLLRIFPHVESLAVAARIMAKRCSNREAYGWLRRRHAEYLSTKMRGNSHALGSNLPPLTPEHRAIISAFNKGKVVSKETAEKISKSKRGKPMPATTRVAIALANTGKVPTAEHREKIAASKRGKRRTPFSQEWRNNMAARQRGVTLSDETRAKISAAHLARNAKLRASSCPD